MKNQPLVSITIPTYNSEKFIELCLKAIKGQSYKNIKINIIDGGSRDRTVEIAMKNGIKNIFVNTGSLLSARYEGVLKSKGKYILLLDSDQILGKQTLQRAIEYLEVNNLKMLILGEDVYSDKTFLEHLFKLDKKLVHSIIDINPYTSVLLPRFFNREFLIKVFNKIPKNVIEEARPQDHAIIYLEAWNLSKKIDLIPDCIKHIEPSFYMQMFRKFYRWGYYSAFENKTNYDKYFKYRTERMRTGLFRRGMLRESFASIVLLSLKGIPYKLGYLSSKIKGTGLMKEQSI